MVNIHKHTSSMDGIQLRSSKSSKSLDCFRRTVMKMKTWKVRFRVVVEKNGSFKGRNLKALIAGLRG